MLVAWQQAKGQLKKGFCLLRFSVSTGHANGSSSSLLAT